MSLDRFLDEPEDEDDEGVPVPEDPPEMRRRRSIGHPYKPHTIGQVVYVYNREDGLNGYFTPRNRDAGNPSSTNPTGQKNLFEKYNSYAISVSVIGKLQSHEVERVFVLERETKDLYEFTLGQYLDAPDYEDTTPKGANDLQKCPNLDDAIAVWRNMSASDLWA